MRRQGSSRMRLVLVAILLAVIVMVSKKVELQPPLPPPETAKPVGTTDAVPHEAEDLKKQGQVEKDMAERIKGIAKSGGGITRGADKAPVKPKKRIARPAFDPDRIDVSPNYFNTVPDGQAGIKVLDKKVAEAKAELRRNGQQ